MKYRAVYQDRRFAARRSVGDGRTFAEAMARLDGFFRFNPGAWMNCEYAAVLEDGRESPVVYLAPQAFDPPGLSPRRDQIGARPR